MALVLLRYEIIDHTAKAGWIDYALDGSRECKGPKDLRINLVHAWFLHVFSSSQLLPGIMPAGKDVPANPTED